MDVTLASTQLGIPRSTLWAYVNEIERETGLKLFLGKSRTCSPKRDEVFFLCTSTHQTFREGVSQAKTDSDEPEGEIVIATTLSMAISWIMPSIKCFRVYPKISLHYLGRRH